MNKQNFNLMKIRQKNILKIEELFDEKLKKEEILENKILTLKAKKDIEKRDFVVKTNGCTNDTLDLIENAYEDEINNIKEEKRQLENLFKIKLRNLIRKQAKMLLVLNDCKDVYDYYYTIINNPLSDDYAEFERSIYDEFLAAHPSITSIIVSYDFIKDSKSTKKNDIEFKKEVIEEINEEEVKKDEKVLDNNDDLTEALKDYENNNLINNKELLNKFLELFESTQIDISKNKESSKNIKELIKLYKELDQKDVKGYDALINNLIKDNNDLIQANDKLNYKINNDKYSLSEKVVEVLGKPASLIMGSTLVKNINKKRLLKLTDKLDDVKEEKKLTRIKNRINKVKKSLTDNYVINSLRLFNVKNKIADIKQEYYTGDYNNDMNEYLAHLQDKYDRYMYAGLFAKTNDNEVFESKDYVKTILNQYIETLSISKYVDDVYEEAIKTLEKFSHMLTESEIKSYKYEFDMIYDNRVNNDLMIYETQNENIDDMVKYYDSEKVFDYVKMLRK